MKNIKATEEERLLLIQKHFRTLFMSVKTDSYTSGPIIHIERVFFIIMKYRLNTVTYKLLRRCNSFKFKILARTDLQNKNTKK